MLVEGVLAAILGVLLRRQLGLSRFGAGLRAGAAAIIGAGVTHPLQWVMYPLLLAELGIQWWAVAVAEVGAIFVEALFYAAVLRGHWGWSLALSVAVNTVGFGAGLALADWLASASAGT